MVYLNQNIFETFQIAYYIPYKSWIYTLKSNKELTKINLIFMTIDNYVVKKQKTHINGGGGGIKNKSPFWNTRALTQSFLRYLENLNLNLVYLPIILQFFLIHFDRHI